MQIAQEMVLDNLSSLMGAGCSTAHAKAMRDILMKQYPGQDTVDIPDTAWLALLEQVETRHPPEHLWSLLVC